MYGPEIGEMIGNAILVGGALVFAFGIAVGLGVMWALS